MDVTVLDIMRLRPCEYYPKDRVKELWAGRKFLTHYEIAELDIPYVDRVWALSGLMTPDTQRRYARKCALSVIHLWDAPKIVVECLETGAECLVSEAYRAANIAAKFTNKQFADAKDAAASAAWALSATHIDIVWSVARADWVTSTIPKDVAWSAAISAAWADAVLPVTATPDEREKACDDAWNKQIKTALEMLDQEFLSDAAVTE